MAPEENPIHFVCRQCGELVPDQQGLRAEDGLDSGTILKCAACGGAETVVCLFTPEERQRLYAATKQAAEVNALYAEIEVLQTHGYMLRRALLAAEAVLNRNATEEGTIFRDGGVLHQMMTALKTAAPKNK